MLFARKSVSGIQKGNIQFTGLTFNLQVLVVFVILYSMVLYQIILVLPQNLLLPYVKAFWHLHP